MTMTTPDTRTSTFIPGSFWTPERARKAVLAMASKLDTPQMQATLEQMGDDFSETHTGALQQPSRAPQLTREGIRFRRAGPADAPALVELIVAANLPSLFVDEFIEGFVVAERDERVVATGGMEVYEDAGFIRSVAVDSAGRGLGLGREIAELLEADARALGLNDLYLFTQDAYLFWKHVGYVDIPFDAWPQAARACWQYRYAAAHEDLMRKIGVHAMWKAA